MVDRSVERVSVPLSEVKEIFLLIEEAQQFFHDYSNIQDNEKINKFLLGGYYERLAKAYYETVWSWLPERDQEEYLRR